MRDVSDPGPFFHGTKADLAVGDLRLFFPRVVGANLVKAHVVKEQRAVAHLKLWGGLTFEEIAAALEIPPNTAASRYRYALDKMRGRLRPLYEEMKKAE